MIEDILKELFVSEFNMEMVARDLMGLIDTKVLMNYIKDEINANFEYEELYHILMNCYDKKTTKAVLEELGHDFKEV